MFLEARSLPTPHPLTPQGSLIEGRLIEGQKKLHRTLRVNCFWPLISEMETVFLSLQDPEQKPL